MGERGARVLGAALALVAAGIHLALAASDLIPGEETRGPAFAVMGLGFTACAGGLFARRRPADVVVALYAVSLVLAYAFTRGELPTEMIGITSKLAEVGLIVVALFLARRDRD